MMDRSPTPVSTNEVSVGSRRRRSWKLSGALKHVVVLGTGSAMGQAVVMLSSPILTRIYDAQSFGVFGLFTSVTTTVGLIATLKYEQGILLEKNDAESEDVFRLGFLVCLAITVLSAIAFGLFWALEKNPLEAAGAQALLLCGAPAILLAGLFNILSVWLLRRQHFRGISEYQVSRSVLTSALQFSASFVEKSALILCVSQVLSLIMSTAVLMRSDFRSIIRIAFSGYDLSRLAGFARQYKGFAVYGASQTLARSFSVSIPMVLLPILTAPMEAGLFWLAYRMLVMPSQIIGQSVRNVFLRRVTEIHHAAGDLLKPMYSTCGILFLIYAPVVIVIMIWGPSLFALVFGEPWRGAGNYARLISIPWMFENITGPSSVLAVVLQLQRPQFIIELFSVSARLILFVALCEYNYTALAVLSYAIIGAVTNAVFLIYVNGYVIKTRNRQLGQ